MIPTWFLLVVDSALSLRVPSRSTRYVACDSVGQDTQASPRHEYTPALKWREYVNVVIQLSDTFFYCVTDLLLQVMGPVVVRVLPE